MKNELAPMTEGSDPKERSETSPARPKRSKRRSSQDSSSRGPVRFFLSKSDSNAIPNLDREFDNEPEAIVESLKTGRSYFIVSEWRGLADLSKKMPLIRKEAVTSRKGE